MKSLAVEFNEIQEKYQSAIEKLNNELSCGYFHTFLNLRQEYSKYIRDLEDLFHEYDYIVPYKIYEEFYKVSDQKYKLLLYYSRYVRGSGNLPGAFLREAISDFKLWSIHTLLVLEQKNAYIENGATDKLLSVEAYDAILETQNHYKDLRGYALNEKKVSEEYVSAAREILLFLGEVVLDKAYEYYKTAIALLKASSANSTHHSADYYTYYISMYNLLNSYKEDIEQYGVRCDFDIDEEICECLYENYRQAQGVSRNKMIVRVKNLIKLKCYAEAGRIAKEIIDICEERVANIRVKGVKLSLKNAYELFLKVPEIAEGDKNRIEEKLNHLVANMDYDDFYSQDGDKEYPLRPY